MTDFSSGSWLDNSLCAISVAHLVRAVSSVAGVDRTKEEEEEKVRIRIGATRLSVREERTKHGGKARRVHAYFRPPSPLHPRPDLRSQAQPWVQTGARRCRSYGGSRTQAESRGLNARKNVARTRKKNRAWGGAHLPSALSFELNIYLTEQKVQTWPRIMTLC